SRAVFLLRGPHFPDPRACHCVRLGDHWRSSLAPGSFPAAKARRLWTRVGWHLYGVGIGAHIALSSCPLVCGHQAASNRMVVELSLAPDFKEQLSRSDPWAFSPAARCF